MLTNWLAWLRYNLWYFRHPPWDTGQTPPEVVRFISTHAAGRVLDLGCGSGTNVLSLARAGWQVTGVDFAVRAVARARRKLLEAGLQAVILQRDVTDLADLAPGFDLVLDIGCYHALSPAKKAQYESNLRRLLAPEGWFLLYGKLQEADRLFGLGDEDVSRLSGWLRLVERQQGTDRRLRRALWLTFQNNCP